MPEIMFSHSAMRGDVLVIKTGANQISWGYGLNTQSFPTYGGEVVQILSCYIDNISIQGDVGTYKEMEDIYRWFVNYLQSATQGSAATGRHFNQDPVIMTYPARNWRIEIQPTSLPALRYGRDVVVPNYQIVAAVVEPSPEMMKMTNRAAELGRFERLNADIGWREEDPFSDPQWANKGRREILKTDLEKDAPDKLGWEDIKKDISKMGDFYEKLIQDIQGEMKYYGFADASGPAEGDDKEGAKPSGGKKTDTPERPDKQERGKVPLSQVQGQGNFVTPDPKKNQPWRPKR